MKLFSVGIMIFAAAGVSAQNYPDKPIRMLTPPAGGSTEFTSRLIAEAVTGSLGQRMIVEGRAAAVGVELVAQAPPDGYTVLHYTDLVWLMPLFRKVSWDAVKDFAPIALTVSTPNIVVVHPSLPVKSIKDAGLRE